jgi:uncharacterized protein with HEPN domain
MRSASRDEDVIADILRAAYIALEFTGGMGLDSFRADSKTQAAVERELLIIGEAVTRLSDEFREQHGEVSWRVIIGMRNWLVHAYDDISPEIVFETVSSDLPNLIDRLRGVLDD